MITKEQAKMILKMTDRADVIINSSKDRIVEAKKITRAFDAVSHATKELVKASLNCTADINIIENMAGLDEGLKILEERK